MLYSVLYYYVCIYICIVYIIYNIICIIMIELDMTQDRSLIEASPAPVRSITRALSGWWRVVMGVKFRTRYQAVWTWTQLFWGARGGGAGPVAHLCPTLCAPWTKPIRLLCPWHFPGKNIGVGCHFLLQGIFLTQKLNPSLFCVSCVGRQILYH